jgi:hypothetical protein
VRYGAVTRRTLVALNHPLDPCSHPCDRSRDHLLNAVQVGLAACLSRIRRHHFITLPPRLRHDTDKDRPEGIEYLAYVTICADCLHEQYFPKQAQANLARNAHVSANLGHKVRVTRVRHTCSWRGRGGVPSPGGKRNGAIFR